MSEEVGQETKEYLSQADVTKFRAMPIHILTIKDMPLELRDDFWNVTKRDAGGNPKACIALLLKVYKMMDLKSKINDLEDRIVALENCECNTEDSKIKTFGAGEEE